MKKLNTWVDKIISFGEEAVSLLLKLIIGLLPVAFFGFILVALIIKGFRVIVLGETP